MRQCETTIKQCKIKQCETKIYVGAEGDGGSLCMLSVMRVEQSWKSKKKTLS